jgi:hypothetical protein
MYSFANIGQFRTIVKAGGKKRAGVFARRFFTFSNAKESEIMVLISQLVAGLSFTQVDGPHFFTFSLFHPSASSNLHIHWPNFALRALDVPRP